MRKWTMLLLCGLLAAGCQEDINVDVDGGGQDGWQDAGDSGGADETGDDQDAGPGDSGSDPGSDPGAADADGEEILNDTCDTALEVSLGGVYSGNTCGYTDSGDLPCGPTGRPEAFYKVTVPADQWSCWVTCFNMGIIVAIGLYDDQDPCGPSDGFACTGPTTTDNDCEGKMLFGGGPAGQVYWIAVEGTGQEYCGDYTFLVDCGYI